MKKIAFWILKLYKHTLSKAIGRKCKYIPTCSMYMYDAIDKWGLIAGTVMGIARVIRCNPFSKGGFDPVPENFRGKAKWLI